MYSKLAASMLAMCFTVAVAWTVQAGEACCAAAAGADAAVTEKSAGATADTATAPCPHMKDGACPNCPNCPSCAAAGGCAQAQGTACPNCPGADKCPHHPDCPKGCAGCAQPEGGETDK